MTSVSLEEAARRLGVSRRTVYNRIREGRLVTVKAHGSQRVTLDSLNLDVRRNGRRGAPAAAEPLKQP